MNHRVVGRGLRKVDALGLATGAYAFTGDVSFPHMLQARLLLSPHAHARILRIDTSRALALPGVVDVVTAHEAPRVFHTTAGQGFPEPSPYDSLIFDFKVRHVGDKVAAVAAVDEETAERALGLIQVEYEVLEPVLDPLDALEPTAPVVHDEEGPHAVIPTEYRPRENLAAHVEFSWGPLSVFSEAFLRMEAEYSVHRASHCALELHEAIASLDPLGRLVVYSTTQVPFHVRRILSRVLGIPVGKIRVVKPRLGGGFGGKQEVFVEQVAALICLRTGRPVRLRLTRPEVFLAGRTRHPQRVRLRSATERDGRVVGIQMDTVLDTGAYGSHALTVATNTGSKTLPLLRHAQAVSFCARSAYTTLPVSGAYRGYGATQGQFALNVHMDEIARALGVDILDLWLLNHIRRGDSSPVFSALGEGREGVPMTVGSCALAECILRGAEAIGWRDKRGRGGRGRRARGVGMAVLMQGSGIPHVDMGAAVAKLNEDASVNLLVGATDLGTGSDTVLAQIAAETLGIPLEKVVVYSSDTDLTPFDVGAYASSTTYVSGEAVKRAVEDLAAQVATVAALRWGVDPAVVRVEGGVATDGCRTADLAEVATYALYKGHHRQLMGVGSATGTVSPPPFAAHFAEVEVDRLTGVITVLAYVAAVDCGQPINPVLAEGQVEGAVLNGIGYALWEEYLVDAQGRPRNASFIGYRIASALDVPRLVTILVPSHEPTGPYGAKSVAEIGINGPLPAISNAVFDAVGVRLRHAPFTPDRVWKALAGGHVGPGGRARGAD